MKKERRRLGPCYLRRGMIPRARARSIKLSLFTVECSLSLSITHSLTVVRALSRSNTHSRTNLLAFSLTQTISISRGGREGEKGRGGEGGRERERDREEKGSKRGIKKTSPQTCPGSCVAPGPSRRRRGTTQGPSNLNQKSFLEDFVNLWRQMPTKWLQERGNVPKTVDGIAPRRAFCGWPEGEGETAPAFGDSSHSKAETSFVNQLLILFHESVLRFQFDVIV